MGFSIKTLTKIFLLTLATACSSEILPSQLPIERSQKAKHKSPASTDSQKLLGKDLPHLEGEIQAFALASIDLKDETNPTDIRYLSMAHRGVPVGGAMDPKTVEHAVTKLLNSLSWQPALLPVKAIDAGGLLFRIKLSDFGWDANLWNILASSHPAAPDSIPGLRELQELTGSDKPLLRADWVVRSASRPPLYYQLLRLPSNNADLFKGLNISVQENINSGNIIRAGFEKSSVSTNHRVIERHKLDQGFLWRSYEFRSKNGSRNIFDFPLGPSANNSGIPILNGLIPAAGTNNSGPGPRFPAQAFISDGTELYFTLKNGMLGFYIAGAEGLRINEVPGTDQRKIFAGITCFSCHAKGTMPARDEVAKRTRVTGPALDEVRRIYATDEALSATLQSDGQAYLNALSQIGIAADELDPINAVANMQ